jgi:cyanophycin synthetase
VELLDIHSFKGRNIHSHRPVIRAVVNLKNLYDTPTNQIDKFNERLLQLLPGLQKHFCSLGYEGGFRERLIEGTYLAHVTEHAVLELQGMMGCDVHYGKTRHSDQPSVYTIFFEYRNEKLATECLLSAIDIVNMLIEGTVPQIDGIMASLKKVAAESDLGISTGALFAEARRRKIPVVCLPHSSILQLGNGRYTRLLEASLTDRSACIAVDRAGNKHLTKQILGEAGIPVPRGDIAYTIRSAAAVASCLGYPVVLKPFDANQGKGVFADITNYRELEHAYHTASKYSHAVIVEKYIPGNDYRLLVVGGKMVAAALRKPPSIIGDGIRSIRQLIDIENENPMRGLDHEKPLTWIKLDDMSRQVLAKEGYDENSIPEQGKIVVLRYNGNLSTGGTASDCTQEVHPENARIAVTAAHLMELDIAGIDITCVDISKPLTPENGALIEVNAAPGLRMHLFPSEGQPRNVAKDILQMFYPEGKPSSVPIVSVTGSNGKTTVTRMIAYTLGLDGTVVGMTSTGGIYIGGECVLKGDNTGVLSAERVLRDTSVEAAVFETARGGIIRRGLGYDLADVGVITNISEDHLGVDGVNTLEELAKVKALVIEAVKPEGAAVLNADDKMTPWLLQRVGCQTILFSVNHENPLLREKITVGSRVVYVRDGAVYVLDNNENNADAGDNGKTSDTGEEFIARIGEIPITFNGTAVCNIENALAAVSALIGLGVPVVTIRAGLMGFKPDIGTNPGRFNVFEMGKFSVMLDYGHNVAGYRCVTDMISHMDATGLTGVIGMPGDRMDESIYEVGRLCGRRFTKLIIKEDNDLRGRNAGEVADILYDAAVKEGMPADNISVIYSETKALETAIMEANEGELIVMFYEELEPALEVIEKCRLMLGLGQEDRNGEDINREDSAGGVGSVQSDESDESVESAG